MPYSHITLQEREVIYKMRLDEKSFRQIGRALDRDKSTISREIRRNTENEYYAPHVAQKIADRRRIACKPLKMEHEPLRVFVEDNLRRQWSPEEISGRLELEHPHDRQMRISHETIYQWILVDRTLGGDLKKELRQGHRKRRKCRGTPDNRGQIPGRVGINQRPRIVDTRCRLGDWESDTVQGKGQSGYLATHVDRKSRYVIIASMNNKKAKTFNRQSVRAFKRHGNLPRHTMTTDNGKEFAGFKKLEETLKLDVYFADPYHACQRATNENTNGLIRQYFPKGMSFSRITEADVIRVEKLLNHRPRKCLGYRTPYEVLNKGSTVALQN